MGVFKIASDSKAHHKRRAVIKFLTAEEETVGNINKYLKNVYGDCTVDRSTAGHRAKCMGSSERGKTNLDDEICSSCPTSVLTPDNVRQAAEIILRNWHIAYRELSLHLGISEGTVNVINQQLGYSKVCSRFVPGSSHPKQGPEEGHCCKLLVRYQTDRDGFPSQIVTGNETWIHSQPEIKQ
jgi:hypothetical protein